MIKVNILFIINNLDENSQDMARYTKSLRLWSLYVDLEESFGTIENVKVKIYLIKNINFF